ncbi:MAG: DUF6263 family protein, partial [Ginsengibacter sp.]
MKKISFIIVTLGLTSAYTFAQVNGNINPSPGQKFVVENKLSTINSSEMMGQTMESTADIISTYQIEVKSVKDNNINFLNTFTGLKMNMKVMENDMSFDSDKKEDMDGEIGKKFKDFLNKPQEVVMDKMGNVILAEKVDTTAADKTGNPALMAMKQMGGDPAEQGYGAKLAFEVIPAKVKTGSTWTDSSNTGGVTKITHYTLKQTDGNEGTLALTG